MQIVIDISEDDYSSIRKGHLADIFKNVADGIVLPVEYGRLIDADDVDNHIVGHVDLRSCPTIVPAHWEKEIEF